MNWNNKFLSIILLIINFNQINTSEQFIYPTRHISQIRASRSNNNMMLYETNNELSDIKYSDLRQSNPIYQHLPISSTEKIPTTTTSFRTIATTATTSKAINYNKTAEISRIYISKPIAQTAYLPNHIANKEIANLLKNVQPSIEYRLQPQNIAVHNSIDTELTTTTTTSNDTQFIKSLKTVQTSVMKIAQSIKDFCVYVWRFFSNGK